MSITKDNKAAGLMLDLGLLTKELARIIHPLCEHCPEGKSGGDWDLLMIAHISDRLVDAYEKLMSLESQNIIK